MEAAGQSRIPTRSRRQTMDWALVLASQGINAVIDHSEELGWGLVVAAADYPAAREAIRLYRRENRHWRWRQPLPWRGGAAFDGRIIFWGVLLVAFHFLTQISRPDFSIAGRMDNAAVLAGEWWRIFTAMLLHANLAHLAANVSLGIVLLGLAMGRYGTGTGLLAAYLAGAGGNVAGLLLYPATHLGVGASGMVMGGLGMLAAQSVFWLRGHSPNRKHVIRGILAGVLLFALFGLSPEADVIAHVGGFVTGLLLGGILLSLPAQWLNPQTDRVAGLIFCALLVLTSWLAFR